jgi:transposase-like protein
MTDELTHTDKELNHCPRCRSEAITYIGTFNNGSQQVECVDCGADWYEVWTYAGVFYEGDEEE